jgi:hypothetical protein
MWEPRSLRPQQWRNISKRVLFGYYWNGAEEALPEEFLKEQLTSMPERCKAVIEAN